MGELRVALIGFGAMGQALAKFLHVHAEANTVRIVALATLGQPPIEKLALLSGNAIQVNSPEQLDAIDAHLVIECAGHKALREYAAPALRRGCDLLIASVGALADRTLEDSLKADAARSGARILIPSGALGGLDVLCAARVGGLDEVTYVGRKPARAWIGTAAENRVKLTDSNVGSAPFFEGTAREAALQFPQNANVAAAVSLAGIGFDATRVQLFADPEAKGNEHTVKARGAFGQFQITVTAKPLADNPKTSMLAPCSLARSVLDLGRTLVLA